MGQTLKDKYPHLKIVNEKFAYRVGDAFSRGGVAQYEILASKSQEKWVHDDTVMRDYILECIYQGKFQDVNLLRSLVERHAKKKKWTRSPKNQLVLGVRLGDVRTLGVCKKKGFTDGSKAIWNSVFKHLQKYLENHNSIKSVLLVGGIHMATAGSNSRNENVFVPAAYQLVDYIVSFLAQLGFSTEVRTGNSTDEDIYTLSSSPFLVNCGGGFQLLCNHLNKNPSLFIDKKGRARHINETFDFAKCPYDYVSNKQLAHFRQKFLDNDRFSERLLRCADPARLNKKQRSIMASHPLTKNPDLYL